jgi:hypothetical protein
MTSDPDCSPKPESSKLEITSSFVCSVVRSHIRAAMRNKNVFKHFSSSGTAATVEDLNASINKLRMLEDTSNDLQQWWKCCSTKFGKSFLTINIDELVFDAW